jgi:hypothetical protein
LRNYEIAALMYVGGNLASSASTQQKIVDNEEVVKYFKFYKDIGCPEFDRLYPHKGKAREPRRYDSLRNYTNRLNDTWQKEEQRKRTKPAEVAYASHTH